MRIAAVVAIVALAGWNLLLQGQLTEAQLYEQNVAAVLDAAQQPGAVAAILSPDGGTGSGLAAITATGDITMAMHDLAATTGGQVYEAWVIGSDGVPLPLGSFQVGQGGTAFLDAEAVPATDGLVLALTLEPAAGATTPTMPIVSKGVTSSAG
jgi:anti-sigma-K factor RskA